MDKKAMAMAIGLTVISWAAIPLLYLLLRKKDIEEIKIREKMAGISLGPNFNEKEMKKEINKNDNNN